LQWSGRSIGVLWGWRICAWTVRALGRWPAYLLVTPILTWYFLSARRGRDASDDYLRRLLGPSRGPRRVWRSYRQFHAFAVALVDRYLYLVSGPGAFDVVHEGRDAVDEVIRSGTGMVVVTSHLGNADLAGATLAADGMAVKTVRVQAEREGVRSLFEGAAGDRLPEVIDLAGEGPATLRILAALREGAAVGMMGDRVVDGQWVEVPFLGEVAPFPAGAFQVAALARVPLVACFCFKEGPRRYRVISLPPLQLAFEPGRDRDAQVEAWVAGYAARTESLARRYPFQWFNFFSLWEPDDLPARRFMERSRG
jgi:predicted LPLAT superfamily acyltransferase